MSKVAIIDDVIANGLLLKGYAKSLPDTEASVFTDPVTAMAWCQENEPDLVLLDYLMPEMDGVEFLRRMRSDIRLKDTPVIMVTGEDSRETLYQALNFGKTDFLRKPVDHVELLARSRNMLELRSQHRALELANRQLYTQATTDVLTGLKNRRFFLEALEQEIERCRRYQRPCSVAFLDLDHFKSVNDTYGHDAGDEVLRVVSRQLMTSLRSADHAGRLGGEEFAVQFPETDLTNALKACENLLARIRGTVIVVGEIELRCTVSIGVTEVDQRGDDVAAVMRRADEALYRAKNNGRDRIEVASRS